MAKTNLVVDLSNLIWISHYGGSSPSDGFSKGLLAHQFLTTLNYIADQYKADGILIACDSQNVWRKNLYPEYKENRKAQRDVNYMDVVELMVELREFFNECTAIPAVAVEQSEADDIIAGVCQYVKEVSSDTKLVIVSGDKDFIQLIDEKVRLFSPTQRTERTTENAAFDLFVKCIRGDMGDNITSAYPRVRMTKLEKAWEDPVEMINLMETVTKDGIHVGTMYNRNKTLIDLTEQPQSIKDAIREELERVFANPGKYSYVKTLKFLGKYELMKIIDNLDGYRGLFSRGFVLTDK